jgi:glutamine synthetase
VQAVNPYLIIAAMVSFFLAGAGGFKLGIDHEKAGQARDEQRIESAKQAMAEAAAEAISKIKVVNTTVQNEVQREIRTNTVYADCKHSDDGLRLLNNAITNGGSAGDSKLPTAHAHE